MPHPNSSLKSKLLNAAYILNAQLRFLGKAQIPSSVRVAGRIRVRGNGKLDIGGGVTIAGTVVPVELETFDAGHIAIGKHTFINYGTSIAARSSVEIGPYCHIGHYTFIMDNHQHDVVRHTQVPPSAPVVIEDNVWIGSKAVILPGVRIGHRAVIGAGSIVTRDVPAKCVVAGNPARVLRFLTEIA